MKHKVGLAQGFALSDWMMLIEAWSRLFFFHLALLMMSYAQLKESTQQRDDEPVDSPHALILALHIQRMVGYAARLHLIPMTCLVKSLVLRKMLNRQNIPAQVKIGVQKKHNTIFAHAWVEVCGRPIGEAADIAQKFNMLESSLKLGNRQFI